jgi:ribulose-phosphate 3-epimerase
MQAFVSLWSADALALGHAVDVLDDHVDGFHLDVMDGRFADGLLFGPDLVAALAARRPRALIDVHLMVAEAERWIEPFVRAGAQMLTVHPQSCRDAGAALSAIERQGARPALALTTDLPVAAAVEHLERVDRVLVMGTAIGIRGAELAPAAPARVRALARARDHAVRRPELVVDGGIRRHTVPELARAGADGVVPGSLVFGGEDWLEGVRFVQAQPVARGR